MMSATAALSRRRQLPQAHHLTAPWLQVHDTLSVAACLDHCCQRSKAHSALGTQGRVKLEGEGLSCRQALRTSGTATGISYSLDCPEHGEKRVGNFQLLELNLKRHSGSSCRCVRPVSLYW